MKKILNIVKKPMVWILALLGIFTTSCNTDEFLTENPKDAIYADNLYVNYTGFQYALNALNKLVAMERGNHINGNLESGWIFKIGTDNASTNLGYSYARAAAWYTNDLNPELNANRNVFDWLYQIVNSANMCISRAENPKIDWEGANAQESEVNKNYVIAHAKLCWVWAYRHLTYIWGDVPLSMEEVSGLTYRNDWDRESVSVIRDQMEKYLLFAEEYLPNQSDDPTVLTKAIARHYLAELFLAMNRPKDAEKKALLVANDPQYKLITERYGVKASEPGVPFMDQFYDGNTLRSQGNTEALWVFLGKEDVNGTVRFNMRRGWLTQYDKLGVPISAEYGGRGLSLESMTAYAFDVYDDPSDDRFSKYAIRKYWVKPEGDTIFAQMSRADEPMMNARGNHRWACTRKWDWVSPDPAAIAASNTFYSQPYLRVAETYLLLAEAEMKLGKTTEAAKWINKLRRRAHTYEISADDVTLDFILDERSRELITEEHRRHTLVRVGKLYERTAQFNKGAAEFMQPYHVHYPIPQSVIDANTGAVMQQNEGY